MKYLEKEKELLSKKNIYSQDFFKKQAFLTVSSQLQLEALCSGMGAVYTTNPSFRAEKSLTKRHLASFTHLEWEIPFITLDHLMDFSEDFVVYIFKNVLEECKEDLEELDKFVSKGLIKKLEGFVSDRFGRITYTNAVEILEREKENVLKEFPELKKEEYPNWGDDLGGYCERYLSEKIFKKPIFVYNYPKVLKSFYMKQNENEKNGMETVQGCDLLIPTLGELIGSSIREDNYEKIIQEMDRRNIEKTTLEWYLDLRKNGTFPHGGAGLGVDRLVNLCCFMDGNIRDVVPFPVAYQECSF